MAFSCHQILVKSDVTNIYIEICKSSIIPLMVLKHLALTFLLKAAIEVCNSLITILEHPITCKKTPYIERTSGIFLVKGDNSTRIFLLTTYHVGFEIYERDNKTFFHKTFKFSLSPLSLDKILPVLSNIAFWKFLYFIAREIDKNKIIIYYLEKSMVRMMNKTSNKGRKCCKT